MSWLLTALGFAKRIPWQVWAAVTLLAAFPLTYCKGRADGYSEGRESVEAQLRAAQAKSAEKALEAASKADLKAAARADQNAAVLAQQIKQIEKAEANDQNALDSLF